MINNFFIKINNYIFLQTYNGIMPHLHLNNWFNDIKFSKSLLYWKGKKGIRGGHHGPKKKGKSLKNQNKANRTRKWANDN